MVVRTNKLGCGEQNIFILKNKSFKRNGEDQDQKLGQRFTEITLQ
jgi:hypothetical protein